MAKCWSPSLFIPKVRPLSSKKCEKNNMSNECVFLLNTYKHMYPKNCPLKIAVHGHDPKFLFPHRYNPVPSV